MMKYPAIVLLLLPLSCFAVDGVYEINQLCIDSGCFPGDSPGLPVTLAETGSYRLTSKLDISERPDAGNLTAIHITAGSVTLDLNGFTIFGPWFSGISGTGAGIDVVGAETIIKDGHVLAMGGRGIWCQNTCHIYRVTASGNGSVGIHMTGSGLLVDSAANNNNNSGVVTNGVVQNCVVAQNQGSGIVAAYTSLLQGNQIINNTGDGVQCAGCSMLNNLIIGNSQYGIFFSGQASFGGNQIQGNGVGETNIVMFQTIPNRCGVAACP